MKTIAQNYLSALLFLILLIPEAAFCQALSPESARCVSCHPGAVSAEPGKLFHAGDFDHPVGVDYAALASADPSLKKPQALNPAIRLVNNRIECVTCHIPYSEYDHKAMAQKRRQSPPDAPDPMLSVDNTGSALCTSCHLK